MSIDPTQDPSTPHGCQEGIALVLRAQDFGEWQPLAVWFARHPQCAKEVARFMDGDGALEGAVNPPPEPARAGAALGEFDLIEEVGRGAMGVVYRALDRQTRREVAVKLVSAGGPLSTRELARIRFEAEAQAGLSHANIVPLYSYGEAAGVPYVVMPLMAGGTLAARLRALGPERLPPDEAAELVRDIARGVHHAHQRGLIHRDLKPANILLDRDGAPHVADFGLARPIDTSASASGGIAGTAAYMAPEQARGEKGLTTAVDVHALGAILFELLTGRTPFGAADLPSVLRRVVEEPAPSVRSLRPAVHRDLELICHKCLSKAPQDRYPSAQALADDLIRFLNGEPPCGQRRGWVWNAVGRALGWERQTHAMGSWRVGFWGAASTVFAMVVMQATILLNAPLWVSQAAIAYYLIAWLGLVWGFLVVQRDSLNPVERASTAIHFGAKFACIAILPVELWLHDGNPVYALPSFLAIIGLGVFAHGVTFSGRFYLIGLGLFLSAAVLPLVSVTYWPAIYGSLLGALQFWAGFHLRRIHKTAETARRTGADPPIN